MSGRNQAWCRAARSAGLSLAIEAGVPVGDMAERRAGEDHRGGGEARDLAGLLVGDLQAVERLRRAGAPAPRRAKAGLRATSAMIAMAGGQLVGHDVQGHGRGLQAGAGLQGRAQRLGLARRSRGAERVLVPSVSMSAVMPAAPARPGRIGPAAGLDGQVGGDQRQVRGAAPRSPAGRWPASSRPAWAAPASPARPIGGGAWRWASGGRAKTGPVYGRDRLGGGAAAAAAASPFGRSLSGR